MSTVAIVDDHPLIANMLATALSERGVAAEPVPCTTPDVLDRTVGQAPRLVLLDLDLGIAGDGAEMIVPLTEQGIRVLVLTGASDRMRIAETVERGAIGYLTKDLGFDAMIETIVAALDGAEVLDEAQRLELLRELHRTRAEHDRALAPFERLTERECEVLAALADGRSVHDIATDWVVSDTTIRAHVRGVLTKLGASSQLGAVALALRSGWLKP